jgi:hypothetical protein
VALGARPAHSTVTALGTVLVWRFRSGIGRRQGQARGQDAVFLVPGFGGSAHRAKSMACPTSPMRVPGPSLPTRPPGTRDEACGPAHRPEQTPAKRCGIDGEEARTLRPLQAAAVTYRIAFGALAGQKELTLRAARVPRPRLHLIRYHGVLAPHAKLRARVVPQGPPAQEPAATEAAVAAESGVETVLERAVIGRATLRSRPNEPPANRRGPGRVTTRRRGTRQFQSIQPGIGRPPMPHPGFPMA